MIKTITINYTINTFNSNNILVKKMQQKRHVCSGVSDSGADRTASLIFGFYPTTLVLWDGRFLLCLHSVYVSHM